MAEFQEVMQQWARMCKSFRHQPNGCTGCPLSDEHCYRELPLSYDSDRVEYAVMKWAAEHPETVYPTWARWLESMGLIEIRWNGPVLASMRIGVDDTDYIPIVKKLLENIPADMAQKIGIPPLEVHK